MNRPQGVQTQRSKTSNIHRCVVTGDEGVSKFIPVFSEVCDVFVALYAVARPIDCQNDIGDVTSNKLLTQVLTGCVLFRGEVF